ncbi:thioesterase domain-containing protein [Streptomyces sp. NPDC057910]|uniref:thioesterase domain-containing protein n=1 Tax=Streptomyces sp. NPDC057910 TaxID=3346278 RepID=UPI0036EFEFD9
MCLIADPALRDIDTASWSLSERARLYTTELKTHLDSSRHQLHLGGWSFGACVAMEVVVLAEDAGQPVQSLHLLDPLEFLR